MSTESYRKRWEFVKELGEGGQGTVQLVRDLQKSLPKKDLIDLAGTAFQQLSTNFNSHTQWPVGFGNFKKLLTEFSNSESPANLGALKILHDPQVARDAERATERMRREIKAMGAVRHSNLLKILDSNTDDLWYVSEFHEHGPLTRQATMGNVDLVQQLRRFAALVQGVASLHEQNLVHRDIKPDNIFVADDGRLILGDFGIVFFEDKEHMRVSATFENVGSRDWMPPWAMAVRIEEVKATFDVFSLGKVLWSMLSEMPKLPLWYFKRDSYNLERRYPGDSRMALVNDLLAKCIVEEESDCLANASELLTAVNALIDRLNGGGQPLSRNGNRRCRICAAGNYQMAVNGEPSSMHNFGLSPTGISKFRIFVCDYCGHVEMFFIRGDEPPAWRSET